MLSQSLCRRCQDGWSKSHKTDHLNRHDSTIKRNPHPDFKSVEAKRPEWQPEPFKFVQTPATEWQPGSGANDGGASLEKNHVEIDPYEPGRPPNFNYKLLISAITPRFIGFISTTSADEKRSNLAPYSFTTMINFDPPIFTIGHSGGIDNAKDTLKNLLETKECVINVVSEQYIEAANATSINAPYEISEWDVTGLHPAPSVTVKPARVKESVFAVECKLLETKEFESRSTPGKISGTLIIVEGTRFWAREDAINEDKNLIDPDVLRPMARWGGITYGRTTQAIELPRPDWNTWVQEGKVNKDGKPAVGSSAAI